MADGAHTGIRDAWWLKLAAALIPLGLAALVTIAWANSHALAVLTRDEADLRADMERIEARLLVCQGVLPK